MLNVKKIVVKALGSRLVSDTVRRVTPPGLRVLAYHGVRDRLAFESQLDQVISNFSPVSGCDVIQHLNGEGELPRDAVWLTFDDGLANVVENALPPLVSRGIPATLFICPGVVEAGRVHWWDTIALALKSGWQPPHCSRTSVVQEMKRLPDRDRRRLLAEAEHFLVGVPVAEEQVDVANCDQLRLWLSAGMEVGNHTWDHPCLDKCTPSLQREQIVKADQWLAEFGAFSQSRLFAYPNGDWTPESDKVVQELGYQAALLFDHKVNTLASLDPLRISRLRLDASATVTRARAVVTGTHSLIYRRQDGSH